MNDPYQSCSNIFIVKFEKTTWITLVSILKQMSADMFQLKNRHGLQKIGKHQTYRSSYPKGFL